MTMCPKKTTKVGRPRSSDKETSERGERILNAAEELFALHGYDGVTLRTLANAAGVDVALINYYFGPKQQLFDTVFKRRAEILNQERLTALENARQASAPDVIAVEKIIEAFLRPLEVAQESDDEGWRNYCALLAYVNNSAVWGPVLMSKHYNDLVDVFIDALRQALPKADDADLYWCYHYMSGAMSLTFANTGRIDKMSGGLCRSDDFQAAYDRMIPFIAAGFRQVCDR
ncbi:TetR/AcrR family transcriptional regulator [Pseudomaricurvus sp. HS19]|uniref:TetR/AcrR family transcriptional regulator n=1 Tax=Pseudomaricurvus sp. HS19 TaxID=2692626 RepID=UPI001F02A87B|nr:TetR/AcrR family transcriptional regulator [Pseudomaricurvus sp. HS19]